MLFFSSIHQHPAGVFEGEFQHAKIREMPAIAEKRPDGNFRIRCSTCLETLVNSARSPEWYVALVAEHEKSRCKSVVRPDLWAFDNPETRRFTEDRMEFITPVLRELRKSTPIESALDLGCGLGDFSGFLSEFGIPKVLGIDGRPENVAEARHRHAAVEFHTADAENLPISQFGTFDLLLCFGLLYHLENPFLAIRKMAAATRKVLLIESMCVHAAHPRLEILDEGLNVNQGLNYVALCPSEPAFVKMLYRSGFRFVYYFKKLPNNPLYKASLWRRRMRTMLLASHIELNITDTVLAKDCARHNTTELDIWFTRLGRFRRTLRKLKP